MRILLFVVMFLTLPILSGASVDSIHHLSKDEVVSIVRKYHPVVRQADISVQRSEANLQQSRGGFDPKLTTVVDRKSLGNKLYYGYFNPEIKIPTWYGVELKAGLEEVVGSSVSPERTFGRSSYAGVKVSVLKGLVFDDRRAALRQAQVMVNLSNSEKMYLVNNVLLEAVTSYWEWVRAYYTYEIYENAVRLNERRLSLVKKEFEQGNRPAIDTVEAMTQLQSYMLLRNEAYLNFQNTGLLLANYLWLDDNEPIAWGEHIEPDSTSVHTALEKGLEVPALEELISTAYLHHPKLKMVDNKIEMLKIDRKLKELNLLPRLDINANMLNRGYGVPDEVTMPFLENNYKLGVDFSVPLLFRKERGGFKAAKLKVQDAVIERDYAAVQIENKIKSYYNEVLMLNKQIELYEDTRNNYSKMLRGEMIRFETGESTLFVINSRENKLLQAQQKLLELKTKWHKSYASLLWAAGRM